MLLANQIVGFFSKEYVPGEMIEMKCLLQFFYAFSQLHYVTSVCIQSFSGLNASKYEPEKLRKWTLFTQC